MSTRDRDALEGAREDLLDWKNRALSAESLLRWLGYRGLTASGAPVERNAVEVPDSCPADDAMNGCQQAVKSARLCWAAVIASYNREYAATQKTRTTPADARKGWKLAPPELSPEMAAAAAAAVWPVASAADREKAREAAMIVLRTTMDLAPGGTLDGLAAGIATMFPAYRAFLAAVPPAPEASA